MNLPSFTTADIKLLLVYPVERANLRQSEYGQFCRNAEQRITLRLSHLHLTVVLFLATRHIDLRNCWSSVTAPLE